ARPRHRRCSAGREFGDRGCDEATAADYVDTSFVSKSESGRCTHLFPDAHLRDPAAFHRQRVRGDLSRAAHLDDFPSSPGSGTGAAEVRGAWAGRPERACRARRRDQRGIILAIYRQPGTNTIELVDAVKKLLPTFRAEVPAGVSINMMYDRSNTIRESVNDVRFSLMLALALVVMVIFMFLRNIPAT